MRRPSAIQLSYAFGRFVTTVIPRPTTFIASSFRLNSRASFVRCRTVFPFFLGMLGLQRQRTPILLLPDRPAPLWLTHTHTRSVRWAPQLSRVRCASLERIR